MVILALSLVAKLSHSAIEVVPIYYPNDKAKESMSFSETETEWINSHPVIYFSDETFWPPFIKVNEKNELEGISPDFLKIIARKTGIKFQFIPSNSWNHIMERIKSQEILLVLAAIHTPERDSFVDFSDPYYTSKMAIITGPNFSYIQRLEELNGKTIAAPKGFYTVDYLKANYPDIQIKIVDDKDQAYAAVFNGEADAYLGSLGVSIYQLRNSRYSELKISGTFDVISEIRFMVAKNNTPLVSIINKVLATIPEKEKHQIANNWFGIEIEQGINPASIWKLALASISLILIALYWISKLRAEISLRKSVEQKLILKSEEANKANQAKTLFLANMSHEIRTPMNAVFAFTELLSDTPLNQEQQQYLESIKLGSDGLLHIINNILEISKIEANKIVIKNKPTNLLRLCDEVKQIFYAPMKEKNLDFIIEIPDNCPTSVMIDEHRLRQIMINIVGNAHKFTLKGHVKIAIEVIEQIEKAAVDLIIKVSDTGIGIQKSKQNSVFDHFVQDTDNHDNKFGGTGLGLSISLKLAKLMNGKLSLESELNKGSCFTLTLNDILLSTEKETRKLDISKISLPPAKILIVDDIETNRFILQKYLSSYPFEIIQAKDGKESIKRAISDKPDLILMDIRMPEIDGYEAANIIKNKIETIIIAVTASALDDDETRSKRKVFDHYLRKPILRNELIISLDQLLN